LKKAVHLFFHQDSKAIVVVAAAGSLIFVFIQRRKPAGGEHPKLVRRLGGRDFSNLSYAPRILIVDDEPDVRAFFEQPFWRMAIMSLPWAQRGKI
jgi:hypothetical protein